MLSVTHYALTALPRYIHGGSLSTMRQPVLSAGVIGSHEESMIQDWLTCEPDRCVSALHRYYCNLASP